MDTCGLENICINKYRGMIENNITEERCIVLQIFQLLLNLIVQFIFENKKINNFQSIKLTFSLIKACALIKMKVCVLACNR